MINGAGGSIGTFAIQLAKYYGAEVTAADSTGKLAMLGSIGADYIIDYGTYSRPAVYVNIDEGCFRPSQGTRRRKYGLEP